MNNYPMFQLHSQLETDCLFVLDLPLCSVLLMDDSRYPWLILVPRVPGVEEVWQLSTDNQTRLIAESSIASAVLRDLNQPDRINVAAIGNMVPQLHLHHVARFVSDFCWPSTVWGKGKAIPYSKSKKNKLKEELIVAFGERI